MTLLQTKLFKHGLKVTFLEQIIEYSSKYNKWAQNTDFLVFTIRTLGTKRIHVRENHKSLRKVLQNP